VCTWWRCEGGGWAVKVCCGGGWCVRGAGPVVARKMGGGKAREVG